ncbi:hypothetical protein ACROHD_02295 [Nioella aestuarii]
MPRKFTISALLLSFLCSAAALPAFADESGSVTMPEGRGTIFHWNHPWPPGAEVRDHRTPPETEVIVVDQGGYSCVHGVIALTRMGLNSINPTDCVGAVYHYTAVDGSSFFHAAMSSHSGEIRVEFRGLIN